MTVSTVNSPPAYLKVILIIIGAVALAYVAIIGKKVLCPLVFGLLFSILLLPVATFLETKLRFSRGISAAVAVLALLVAIAGIILTVGSQVANLADDLPLLKQQVTIAFHHFQHWISTTFHMNIAKQMAYVKTAATTIKTISPLIIGTTVLSLSNIFLFFVFVILDTFFILFYRTRLLRFLVAVFKEQHTSIVHDIVSTVQSIMRKYVIGIFLEMSTVAVVCCAVFLLLGVKYAILLGLITALFNIVPYVGIFSALLLNVVVAFATNIASTKILLLAITVVSMHLVDSNILLPLIVGSKVRINAFVTLLGVVCGEMIWGIPGMFLSIPLIAIAKIIFDRIESLHPWGDLLGDEKVHARSFKINIRQLSIRRRKPKIV